MVGIKVLDTKLFGYGGSAVIEGGFHGVEGFVGFDGVFRFLSDVFDVAGLFMGWS